LLKERGGRGQEEKNTLRISILLAPKRIGQYLRGNLDREGEREDVHRGGKTRDKIGQKKREFRTIRKLINREIGKILEGGEKG